MTKNFLASPWSESIFPTDEIYLNELAVKLLLLPNNSDKDEQSDGSVATENHFFEENFLKSRH
jgi:hypothetical protein